MFRSEADPIQAFQYKSLKNKVINVNSFVRSHKWCKDCNIIALQFSIVCQVDENSAVLLLSNLVRILLANWNTSKLSLKNEKLF